MAYRWACDLVQGRIGRFRVLCRSPNWNLSKMMQAKTFKAVLFLCAMLVGIASCGRDDAAPSTGLDSLTSNAGVLRFVPADTPYVFATPAKMPDDVLDKLEANADSLFAAYEQVIKAMLADVAVEMEAEGADEEEVQSMMRFAGELAGLMRSERLRAAGVPRGAQVALYGVGLIPVFRVELEDTAAFERTIGELEESAGYEMTLAEVDGDAYRYIGDDEGQLIVAIADNNLVISIAPTGLSEDALRALLGFEPPQSSIAESGALADLAAEYNFTPHALGYLDIERVAGTFLNAPSGINAELLAIDGYDRDQLSDVCRAEIGEMAGIMPRIATGYTDISTAALHSNTILELRSDLALGMIALTAPVPGLGTDHGGFGSFGMSLDLMAAREFYEARLDAMDADPYECELLAELQMGVAQGRMALQQPMPPIVYGFKGFVAVLDELDGFDFETQQPPTNVEARILVANDNAPGVLAMGTMFSPELAALQIEANGEAVEFAAPQMTGQFDATYLAMTESALALGIGESSKDGLSDLLETSAGDPPPFMSMHIDGARYYSMMSEAIAAGNQQAAANGEAEQLSPEMQQAVSKVLTGVGEMVDRVSFDMTFTEQGVEIPVSMTLAD